MLHNESSAKVVKEGYISGDPFRSTQARHGGTITLELHFAGATCNINQIIWGAASGERRSENVLRRKFTTILR